MIQGYKEQPNYIETERETHTPPFFGWICVVVGIVLLIFTSNLGFLSVPLLWTGFSIVFPGRSIVFRAGKGLLGMLIVITSVALWKSEFEAGIGTSEKDIAAAHNATSIDLHALLFDYGSFGNELDADNRYRNKYIQTTGVLKAVSKDILDKPYLLIGTRMASSHPDLQCELAKSSFNKASRLNVGEEVSVSGKIEGLFFNVQARDCVILVF